MHRRNALNQVMPHNGGNAAPVAWERIHEARSWLIGADPGDAFDSTAKRLDEDRPVRTKSRLFRADLRITIFTHVEVFRLKQLEIGESPHLIGNATENFVQMHGRVGGNDAVQFRQYDQAVWHQQSVGE